MEEQEVCQVKEAQLLQSDDSYVKSIVFLDLYTEKTQVINQNDEIMKQFILSNDNVSQVYVLYGNKSLLIVLKTIENTAQLINDIIESIRSEFDLGFVHKEINSTQLYLCSEINEQKLLLLSSDKSKSLKLIESKTGLRLKKIKKQFYFVGFLFQFNLLEQLLNDFKNHVIEPLNEINPNWIEQYTNCVHKYTFMLNECEIYVFKADLSDLNTDLIVNFTNQNLHPGYTGDGISRRIREKSGKQMQDCLKKILQTKQGNLFQDSDICDTKSSGKLKAKHVLHSVCPQWMHYISDKLSTPNEINLEQFENLIEKTIVNLFTLSNDEKFSSYNSIGLPVSSSPSGGTFDLPLELFVHYFYTKLFSFKLKNVSKICLVSLEDETVCKLIDLFKVYTDLCSNTLWTVPESPLYKLVSNVIPLEQLSINCVKNTKENSMKENESNSPSSSSSSSSSISPVRITKPIIRRPVYETRYYPITDGKIYIRKLNESCVGYERYRTILVTFEIGDGIQNETQPKPGCPYRGIIKRAYLPDIKEHMEILGFYEKALKKGILFKLEWSKKYADYAVQLNQDIVLKTSLNGGGKFGYPDLNYVDDLLIKIRTNKI